MRDLKLFLSAIRFALLSTLFILTSSNNTYAVDAFDVHMSDMDISESNYETRPRWDKIDNHLRNQITEEYRSKNYNEATFFSKYVELIPAEAILEFLEAEEKTCHSQAHELGRAVFRKHQNINEALKICGNGCTNACMHGAIGEAFSDKPETIKNNSNTQPPDSHQLHHTTNINQLIKKMEPFCREGEMARLHKRGNCAHAMGHALMLKTNHNIKTSLAGCSRFTEPGMDYYCATGVYMQYTDNAHANGTRISDVEQWGSNYPCNQHSAYPAACYRYIVRQVKYERDLGLEHLVILCAQLPDETRAGCFHGLGAAYTPVLGTYPDLLKVVCSYGDKKEQTLCIEGAIEKLADYNQAWAVAACEALDGNNKAICLAAAHEKMYRLEKPTMNLYRTGIKIDDIVTIDLSNAEICIDGEE